MNVAKDLYLLSSSSSSKLGGNSPVEIRTMINFAKIHHNVKIIKIKMGENSEDKTIIKL